MNKNQYRPDIDGLRAVAVLSVLFHHLSATLLPGGFVGVDVFFVISGYLITSQVYKEVCDGSFSIQQFYKRRINRIAPVLVTVIITTFIVGAVLLSPADLIKLGKSAIYAMLGLSNVFFWREYGNYFTGNAGEAPLLHTWSLGVEEQFYVVWPLLILALAKLSRRHMASALVVLTIGAVIVSEAGISIAASASYYLLPTRFFELMMQSTEVKPCHPL
jgi:peptidoglycan/LPS O-acetylase OafA/YrhL